MARIVTIDKAGRLVIPAAVRETLALIGGSQRRCSIEGDSIRLEPLASGALERRGRLLIIASPLAGDAPDHRDLRDERTGQLIPGS